MILAIDTTHEFGSIALASDDGALIEEQALHAPDGFGQILFDRIRQLLYSHDAGVNAITRVAAACGPGSFTGVRVGLAAAKGIAEGVGKPIDAVSNLEAIASFGTWPVRAAYRDARRGEFYGGLFDASLRPLAPEMVGPFEAWLAAIPNDAEILTTVLDPAPSALADRSLTRVPSALAAAIARIAARRPGSDAVEIDASYVRRSDAELLWKDR